MNTWRLPIRMRTASPLRCSISSAPTGRNQHLDLVGRPSVGLHRCVLNDEVIPIHGDGSQTRSFTYVSDTVAGIYAAIVRDEANGEIINIGQQRR